MSLRDYFILSAPPTRDVDASFGTAREAAVDPQDLRIEEAQLTAAERSDQLRNPRVRAIAEPIPMALIAPVESADDGTDLETDDPAVSTTWGVEAVGATTSPFDGSGITVAVLDTGIDPFHPAFAGIHVVQRNFTEEGDDDTNGHGTHCAGTIFGQDVDGLRIGVARNIDKALIGKVLGQGGGTSATIARAIQWAFGEGANVISMSLGIDFPGLVDRWVTRGLDPRPATSRALEQYRNNINMFSALAELIKQQSLFGQGCILVAASGNESRRPDFEIAVAPPAAAEDILAIGALGNGPNGLEIADFSNTQVDIAAPGVRVLSAEAGSSGLVSLNGTSMATPHVAGVAALWAQKQQELNGAVNVGALKAQLVGNAITTPLAPNVERDDVGQGIVQAPQ